MNGTIVTPLMQQYREIKARHQSAILFFRMGDFYEMFYEDAETAARILGLTLTSRNNGGAAEVPLAGVPVKAGPEYLRRLVQRGFRVAICEQVEDPKLAKGIVRREVVETISPGVAFADDLLDGARNNFVVAIGMAQAGVAGIAAADVSTGEFRLCVTPISELDTALARFSPREIVVPLGSDVLPQSSALDGVLVTERDAWEFDAPLAGDDLARHYQVRGINELELEDRDAPAIAAAGALLRYLKEMQPSGVPQLARPTVERAGGAMPLDEMTRRNLELVEPLRAGAKGVTLLETLDTTTTPMGARLLRHWVLAPLRDPERIDARLDAVQVLVAAGRARGELRDALDGVRDIERLAARAAAGRANPRELGAVRDSFLRLPRVHATVAALAGTASATLLTYAAEHLDPLADIAADLGYSLVPRPPIALADGDVIAPGCDAELDALRDLRDNGKQSLAGIQQRERERTGIQSLKVGYNKVFGYYLEITHANTSAVPADYERRQTLSNAERYVTPELKAFEAKVLGAEEQIAVHEGALFAALRDRVGSAIARIQQTSQLLARLDVLASFAEVAVNQRYVRPEVHTGYDLTLTGSRHPVIERMMPREKFVPNDVRFDEVSRVLLVTGPNMAGKSTILRQIGLCVLLAQIGSFVPATAARIGVVDRLFTRVGASDNLARGQSTFMVEMSETSAILHNATQQSLVLLDEIGRGTSTYDGVAIAWAVTEHLHDRVGCRTMFATHYHELMQLPEKLAHARNFNVAVREIDHGIVFLHRLEPGGTDRSYGIHVAELAGLPSAVVLRAREVLATLETGHRMVPGAPPLDADPTQPSLFDRHPERLPRADARGAAQRRVEGPPQLTESEQRAVTLSRHLRGLDPDTMTPIEALQELARIRDELESE